MGDYGPSAVLPNAPVTGNLPVPPTEPDEISVLVTGFGPFKSNFVNASHLIASSLPPSIVLPPASSSPSSTPTGSPDPATRRVSIHVHPSPISVAYSAVRTTVPAILEEYARAHDGRRPDIIIHMGLAATRNYYSVETQAHRDSYYMTDNKGRVGYDDGERLWRELKLPPVLQAGPSDDPATNPPRVSPRHVKPRPPNHEFLSTWKSFTSGDFDLRISDDAGRYLCEFIFYTSLALAFQEGQDLNVVFFHVPASCAEWDVQRGKDVTLALIKALVTSWIDHKA